jgi:hypothetical protein
MLLATKTIWLLNVQGAGQKDRASEKREDKEYRKPEPQPPYRPHVGSFSRILHLTVLCQLSILTFSSPLLCPLSISFYENIFNPFSQLMPLLFRPRNIKKEVKFLYALILYHCATLTLSSHKTENF